MDYDAVIIGSGPNGLSAAITLARAGLSVGVFEANSTLGGGARSAEVTLPGFLHDRCSAVHPLAVISPFFQSLPLHEFGLEWIFPKAELAHPLCDEPAVLISRSIETTARSLGLDAKAYAHLFHSLVQDFDKARDDFLGPPHLPRHPLQMARFGLKALRSGRGLAESMFVTTGAKAAFAGIAAHSFLPLEAPLSAAIACVLGASAHIRGWPIPKGGSQRITDTLVKILQSYGGETHTNKFIKVIDELPNAKTYLFDVTPRQLATLCASRLPSSFIKQLERFEYGPGTFKMDWALDGPIPWNDSRCSLAATVHLGASLEEIALSEKQIWEGTPPERPFVLLAQPTLFDSLRAPAGKHIVWAYCHVPHNSDFDMTERLEAQIERFAPGFRDLILARHVMTPADMEKHNANYIGGDISGGIVNWKQYLSRPTLRFPPYSTPAKDIFICSASTPPGPGVHGMCGYHAATAALKLF